VPHAKMQKGSNISPLLNCERNSSHENKQLVTRLDAFLNEHDDI